MRSNACFGVIFFFLARLYGDDAMERKQSSDAEKTAKKLQEQIAKEVKTLRNHPWAGEYYAGDGLGVNTFLTIAPKSGFVFEWHGCLGLYDRNYRAVAWTNNRSDLVGWTPQQFASMLATLLSINDSDHGYS